MSASQQDSPTETREKLEQEAEAVRARLVSRIDAVKERGRHVSQVLDTAKAQAKRHAPALIAVAAAALVLTAVVAIRRRARARRNERRDAILYIAGSLLNPGAAVRRMEPKPGLIKSTLQNAGRELLRTAAHEVGRRLLAEVSLAPVAAPRRDRSDRSDREQAEPLPA